MEFPKHIELQLGYYVYLLIDPRSNERKPFYVGKGALNRAFDHLRQALPDGDASTAKYDVIRAIRDAGQEPVVRIVAHGLREDEAFRLEAVLIRILRLENLTNRVHGHRFDETMLPPEDVVALYAAEKLCDELVSERVLYVSLNGGTELPYPEICDDEVILQQRTLGDWPLSLEKAAKVQLVAGVYAQVVRVVYQLTEGAESAAFVTLSSMNPARVRFTQATRLRQHLLLGKTVETNEGEQLTKFYGGSVRYGRAAWER